MAIRREFLEVAGGSAAFALAGCATGAAVKPKDGLLFGALSSQRNLAASIRILAEAGYDILPCTGNWSTDKSADAMLAYCRNRIDPARIKGFMTAVWKLSVPETDAKVRDAIRLLAEAKRKHWS